MYLDFGFFDYGLALFLLTLAVFILSLYSAVRAFLATRGETRDFLKILPRLESLPGEGWKRRGTKSVDLKDLAGGDENFSSSEFKDGILALYTTGEELNLIYLILEFSNEEKAKKWYKALLEGLLEDLEPYDVNVGVKSKGAFSDSLGSNLVLFCFDNILAAVILGGSNSEKEISEKCAVVLENRVKKDYENEKEK